LRPLTCTCGADVRHVDMYSYHKKVIKKRKLFIALFRPSRVLKCALSYSRITM